MKSTLFHLLNQDLEIVLGIFLLQRTSKSLLCLKIHLESKHHMITFTASTHDIIIFNLDYGQILQTLLLSCVVQLSPLCNHNMVVKGIMQKHRFSPVQFNGSVMSDSLRPHELQHTRPPCPSPTPGVYSNPCPSRQWCHPAISSSVVPFSSCP